MALYAYVVMVGLIFCFFIFHFSETGQRTTTKTGGVKDDPYPEQIGDKFQRDPVRSFGGGSISPHLQLTAGE